MNIKFDEEVQGLLLLGGLPDSWETFRTSVSNSAPNGVITMDLAKSSILNDEMSRLSIGFSSKSEVLVTETRGRSNSRGTRNRDSSKGRSSSRGRSSCRGRGSGSQNSSWQDNAECYHCGKKGYIKKNCRIFQRENKEKGRENTAKNGDDKDTAATTSDEFMLVYDDAISLACDEADWVVDSGATIHATSRRDFFSSYTPGDYGVVKMGNESVAKTVGIGDV